MKTFASILLTTFYLFGTLVLPLGDFSVLKDLPAMFKQCKETEDSDLNVLEFLAEHVSGVGQLVEGNEHDSDDDDGDKPHVPVQFHFEQQQIICIHQQVRTLIIKPLPTLPLNAVVNDKIYISDYISNIFRPPIFA